MYLLTAKYYSINITNKKDEKKSQEGPCLLTWRMRILVLQKERKTYKVLEQNNLIKSLYTGESLKNNPAQKFGQYVNI